MQFLPKMWPIQLAFRFIISCRIFLCSLTPSNTSSFLTWSVQLILSILLQHHISKLSRCFWSVARSVQVHTHIHTCIRTYTYTHTYIQYVYTYARTYVHMVHTHIITYIHTYVPTFIILHTYIHSTNKCKFIHTYTYVHAYIYIYKCIPTHTHTHTHTHTNVTLYKCHKFVVPCAILVQFSLSQIRHSWLLLAEHIKACTSFLVSFLC